MAKSLAFEVDPSDKYLIYIKNNNGPRIEPYGIPALICDHFEVRSMKRTVWYLLHKNEPKYFSHIPMHFNSYKRPTCQTLSNALDKSKQTTQF